MSRSLEDIRIAVIGVGYVGLPLAVSLGGLVPAVGFDLSEERIRELKAGNDRTREVPASELMAARHLTFSTDIEDITNANFYIVTVPTPIDVHKQPDFRALLGASETVGLVLSPGDIVVFESTVYPGATEQLCVPVLERASGLTFNRDFQVGYSPERINPGDKTRRLKDIVKVTSGSTPEAALFIDSVYRQIVDAGTYMAESIQVAEAAKVIENVQRDVNIALVNELSLLFKRLNIDTQEVLNAAGTKWNFLPFRPGLVGGHCIGVDPYYLTHKAASVGHHPEMILAGRRINDDMAIEISNEIIHLLLRKKMHVAGASVLIMGFTFKENCPDIRNTKVIDLARHMGSFGCDISIYDPHAYPDEVRHEYGLDLVKSPSSGAYDVVVIACAHDEFKAMGSAKIREYGKTQHIVYDVKHLFGRHEVDGRL